jgi:NAD(P)-dependent dehydrogenase (short-subunit alcohol dehydrogenase family)
MDANTTMLKGRTALVTGASKGVGKGIALELARNGCTVVVNYHGDKDGAEQTAREIEGLGCEAHVVGGDVGIGAEVDRMFSEVFSKISRLDIVVNNAGQQSWAPLMELREEDWDHDIRTNLKGCFLCTKAAAKHMQQHGGGAIVNIGSGCNKVPFPRLVSYTASKGGIEMFTKVAAIELGHYGIRVNCVAPGAIVIERTDKEDANYSKTWGEATPLGRVGTPRDVGQAVAFLSSDNASYISGQTIWVDGAAFTKASWPYKLDWE